MTFKAKQYKIRSYYKPSQQIWLNYPVDHCSYLSTGFGIPSEAMAEGCTSFFQHASSMLISTSVLPTEMCSLNPHTHETLQMDSHSLLLLRNDPDYSPLLGLMLNPKHLS